jgi:hypothetical protein
VKQNSGANDLNEIPVIESIPTFLTWFNQIEETFEDQNDDVYYDFYNQLEDQTKQCDALLSDVSQLALLTLMQRQ